MNDELYDMLNQILNLRENHVNQDNVENSVNQNNKKLYKGVKIIDQKGKCFHFIGTFKLEYFKDEIVCTVSKKEDEQT